MNPLVSICIPCYQQPELLQRCLVSVMAQTYTHYELIITDDSPTDGNEQLIQKLLKDKPYFYYRNSLSLGSPLNWNKAIEYSKGEYIKLLHHDDYFTHKDSLQCFIDAARQNPRADFIFCNSVVAFANAERNFIHRPSPQQLQRLKREPEFLFFRNCIGAPSATFYRNNKQISYDKHFKWLVDVDFYIRYLNQASTHFYHIDKNLITTFNGAEGQITPSVAHAVHIVIPEHIKLFASIYSPSLHTSKSKLYFEELFEHFNIRNKEELAHLTPLPQTITLFLEEVFQEAPKNKWYKKIMKRLLTSRYNKRIFKRERF